ncbi:MAG: hypothetical protein CL675_04120 [Bdellovibrionaceae bacterium]|nr:hypothetical protein [Pseudobdellovibrionaceae bacterium]
MEKSCDSCQQTFQCSNGDPKKHCWCFDLPHGIKVPSQYKDCLCPKCLKELLDTKSRPPKKDQNR